MKAIVKRTGEIVDLIFPEDVRENTSYKNSEGVLHECESVSDVIPIFDSGCSTDQRLEEHEIDWEERRYEIAKDLFVNLAANRKLRTLADAAPKQRAKWAIEEANALIEQLKENKQYGQDDI